MKPCGGPKQGGSRYPRPKPKQTRDGWKAAPPPAAPQFDDYGQRAPPRKSKDDAPFTYAGEHLAACSFPLGGFGAGNVLLHGDGTLQGWTVVNQTRAEDLPLDCMPSNFFAISATPADGSAAAQCFALSTPNEPGALSAQSARRLGGSMPGIRALEMTACCSSSSRPQGARCGSTSASPSTNRRGCASARRPRSRRRSRPTNRTRPPATGSARAAFCARWWRRS